MNPSSSSIAKTLLPLVNQESQSISPLSRRLRAAAEQMQQRQGSVYRDLATRSSSEPTPTVLYYRPNRDGSVVTLDSAGRILALENATGKRLYSYHFKDADSKEPHRIELSDGTVIEKQTDVPGSVWLMKSHTASMEFSDAVLTIGKDGSFALRYKCRLASSIKREHVVRELCYNARGKKVVELVQSTCNRVGPGNSITVKKVFVRQKSLEG